MKSARAQAFTQSPDDIRIEEIPVPDPPRGQVRVRMLMCPVRIGKRDGFRTICVVRSSASTADLSD